MSMSIDARQSDFVCKGQIVVIQPNEKKPHFICIGRKTPTTSECLQAIAEYGLKHYTKEKT